MDGCKVQLFHWFTFLTFLPSICWLGFILGMETFYPKLTGAALVCSVPPSGNRWFFLLSHVYDILLFFYLNQARTGFLQLFFFSGLVWRYLFSKPIAAFKVSTFTLLRKTYGCILFLFMLTNNCFEYLSYTLEYSGGYTFALGLHRISCLKHYLEEWKPNYVQNVQEKLTLLMFLVNPLNTSNAVLDIAENMRTFSIMSSAYFYASSYSKNENQLSLTQTQSIWTWAGNTQLSSKSFPNFSSSL